MNKMEVHDLFILLLEMGQKLQQRHLKKKQRKQPFDYWGMFNQFQGIFIVSMT